MSEVKLEVDKIRDLLVTYVISKAMAEGMTIEIRENPYTTYVNVILEQEFNPDEYNLDNKQFIENILSKTTGKTVAILVYN